MPGITEVKRDRSCFSPDTKGHTGHMKVSEIAAVPIELGAAVRHRRLFHPNGVLANGTLERVAPPGEGLPLDSCDIVGRVSKAVGLPRGVADFAGLAWRMAPLRPSATPWDILLASTRGGDLPSRVWLWPATSWSGVAVSSLMPMRYGGQLWWLRARMATDVNSQGLALQPICEHIAHGGLQFEVEQACGRGRFTPVARLRLSDVITDGQDITFDPTLNSAPGVQLAPAWLTDFRRAAYRRSRAGRDAE